MCKEKINTISKIGVLLEGEINEMDPKEVESWFEEAFAWVDKNERYNLGTRLKAAKQRWENLLLVNKVLK